MVSSLVPVVVEGMSPDVDHGVEGRGPAPDPPPGPVHPPVVEVLLGFSVVVPVVLVVAQVVHESGGHMDLPLQQGRTQDGVWRTGLQQQHVVRASEGEMGLSSTSMLAFKIVLHFSTV